MDRRQTVCTMRCVPTQEFSLVTTPPPRVRWCSTFNIIYRLDFTQTGSGQTTQRNHQIDCDGGRFGRPLSGDHCGATIAGGSRGASRDRCKPSGPTAHTATAATAAGIDRHDRDSWLSVTDLRSTMTTWPLWVSSDYFEILQQAWQQTSATNLAFR